MARARGLDTLEPDMPPNAPAPELDSDRGASLTADAAIVSLAPDDLRRADVSWRRISRMLSAQGLLFLVILEETPHDPGVAIDAPDPVTAEEIERVAGELGMTVYLSWEVRRDDGELAAVPLYLLVFRAYDPLEHGRELRAAGKPVDAYEVLALIPAKRLTSPPVASQVDAEMQRCLLDVDDHAPPPLRPQLFFISLNLFYHAVEAAPHALEPYAAQAEFWTRLRCPEMAARILRSLAHARPDEATRGLLALYESQVGAARTRDDEAADMSTTPDGLSFRPEKIRRVLLITPPEPNYGLDVLYDGLCTLLGEDNVIEFPWKPSLHGGPMPTQANYPCRFHRAGPSRRAHEIVRLLRARAIDAILYGDVRGLVDSHVVRRLAKAATAPFFLIDQEDSPVDARNDAAARVGVSFAAAFKREMLPCIDYSPETFPLPFAYPEAQITAPPDCARARPLFWAGHRKFGLRRLYLEHIESQFTNRLVHVWVRV